MTVRHSPPRSDYVGHLTWTTTFGPPSPYIDINGERFWPLSELDPVEPPSDTCLACQGTGGAYAQNWTRNGSILYGYYLPCPDCHGAGTVSRETEG